VPTDDPADLLAHRIGGRNELLLQPSLDALSIWYNVDFNRADRDSWHRAASSGVMARALEDVLRQYMG
jgi:hypothetical protein